MNDFEDLKRIIGDIVPVEHDRDGMLSFRFKDGTRLSFLCGEGGRLNIVTIQHGPKTPEFRLPDKGFRPHHLKWNGDEWADDRCGCRYHPDDDNGTHGGAPHVHPCDDHAQPSVPQHEPECTSCTGYYDPVVVRERVRFILNEFTKGRCTFDDAVDDFAGHVLFAYRHPAREVEDLEEA